MISVAEIVFISQGALSASFSLTVLLTGLLWPGALLSKSRPFSTTVFFISLSDFCLSIMNCLGFPLNGTLQCSIQAFGVFYFPLASWLWTVMLVYQLRTLLILKSLHISMSWIHGICWSIPLVLSLLPLSTNQYGMDDYANGDLACSLSGNVTTKFIWLDICSTAAAMVCFILMAIWSVEIYFHFRQAEDAAREMSFLNIMKLYPLALLVTWWPRCVINILISAAIISARSSSTLFAAICFFILSTQYGTLTAIIYFSHSSASRMLWANLFKRTLFRFYRDREVSVLDERLISDDNIEDALVIGAMIGRDANTSNMAFLRESLTTPRISEREGSTTTNVIIQLTIPTTQQDNF